jgi:stalled ribosome rescue protein Dom34
MKIKKRIAVWMDHTNASIIEFKENKPVLLNINSDFSHLDKEEILNRSEHMMHNKEQQKQLAYYKKIIDHLNDHEEILLFGPTNAKNELKNFLKTNHHFDSVKVDLRSSDKLTENEQIVFAQNYFEGMQ